MSLNTLKFDLKKYFYLVVSKVRKNYSCIINYYGLVIICLSILVIYSVDSTHMYFDFIGKFLLFNMSFDQWRLKSGFLSKLKNLLTQVNNVSLFDLPFIYQSINRWDLENSFTLGVTNSVPDHPPQTQNLCLGSTYRTTGETPLLTQERQPKIL